MDARPRLRCGDRDTSVVVVAVVVAVPTDESLLINMAILGDEDDETDDIEDDVMDAVPE